MRIVLGTYSSEDYNADCDYALVDLTPALAKQILTRMDLATRLHRDDVSLHELYFWNAEADFFSTPEDAALAEQLPEQSDEHVLLSDGLEIPADCFQRTDYDHLIVNTVGDQCEVFWRSSPKNACIDISTASLPRELIEQAAGGVPGSIAHPSGQTAAGALEYRLAIDGPLFCRQRQFLEKLAEQARRGQPAELDSELLEGLVNLTDAIADQAHDRHGIDCLLDKQRRS